MDECEPLIGGSSYKYAPAPPEVLARRERWSELAGKHGRDLHSSTSQLNLSRFGHTSPCPPV